MKVWKYKNYKEYLDTQIDFTNQKLANNAKPSWVNPIDIQALTGYIFEYNSDVKFGLCHGTRRGLEQTEFIETFSKLGNDVEVVGTEINPEAAEKYENTIEWDFCKVKDEWINNVDFIFTNSFDHCFNPEETLDTWMSCLNKNGLCIIEWTTSDTQCRAGDPFGATCEEYKKLFSKKYDIVDTLLGDSKDESVFARGNSTDLKRQYFIIRNRK